MEGDRGRWTHLVKGTALLLESRGIHGYNDPFDRAMLESQIAYIVSGSISDSMTYTSPHKLLMHVGWSFHEIETTVLSEQD